MFERASFVVTIVAILGIASAACHSPRPAEPAAPRPSELAVEPCTANQFVPCTTGEACARRHGKLIHEHGCHDHAASACEALACVHGCDVHKGEPKLILCAANASSAGNMKSCGGYSNLGCPEDMTCELPKEAASADDATGTCVPTSSASD